MVKIRRIYAPPLPDDGKRVLIDRLWPRGMKKSEARVDEWFKDIAPSNELRTWYGHEPARWKEFKKRYLQELKNKPELIARLKQEEREGTVTLLFAARDSKHSNAAVLKELLSHKAASRSTAGTISPRSIRSTRRTLLLSHGPG